MTKLMTKIACGTLLTASLGLANASVVLNDWYLNATGVGGAPAGTQINEYLDINGNAFIQLSAGNAPGTFGFSEFAVFNSIQHDSTGQGYGNYITATFSGTGIGTFGGAFTFTGGTINVYSNPLNQYSTTAGIYGADQGVKIGTFNVLPGGGGMVDATGSPIKNGEITVFGQAMAPGSLMSGYWFMPDGSDMSGHDVLSFAFTNANTVGSPTENMVSEIICQGAGFSGPGCAGGAYANTPGSHFFVSNNGQFKLAAVPEPGSLALVGIALLALVAPLSRRNSKRS